MIALTASLALALTPAPPVKPNACRSARCARRVQAKRWARKPHRRALASWYGPGLFGNPLGCGGRLYVGTEGVAHKSLPCGRRIRVCYRRCVLTRVIDRGPYVDAREFDLTQALRYRIGFPNGVAVIRVAGA